MHTWLINTWLINTRPNNTWHPQFIQQKATKMLAFLRENLGLILGIVIFGAVILGGIYYVEHSLESQEQVVR